MCSSHDKTRLPNTLPDPRTVVIPLCANCCGWTRCVQEVTRLLGLLWTHVLAADEAQALDGESEPRRLIIPEITSVLLQGTSIPLVVRWLGLATPQSSKARYPLEFEERDSVEATLMDFILPHNSGLVGKRIVELGLPEGSVITLIVRDDKYLVPGGTTVLQPGDVLLVLLRKASIPEVKKILSILKL